MTVLLDLLLPPKCAFCGKLLDRAGDGVCPRCKTDLPYRNPPLVQMGDFPCAVAFYYEAAVHTGIREMKFQGKSWRAGIFGRYVAQAARALDGSFDAVTYAPVSWRRNFTRGYDQSKLLARTVARELSLPLTATLRKTRHNPPQSRLNNAARRVENVHGVYAALHPERVTGKRLLLVDDVVTTGSTLRACRETLLHAGAASVACAALAGGHRD